MLLILKVNLRKDSNGVSYMWNPYSRNNTRLINRDLINWYTKNLSADKEPCGRFVNCAGNITLQENNCTTPGFSIDGASCNQENIRLACEFKKKNYFKYFQPQRDPYNIF